MAFAAALRDAAQLRVQVVNERLHGLRIGLEAFRTRVELGLDEGHGGGLNQAGC